MAVNGASGQLCPSITAELGEAAVLFSARIDCPDKVLAPFVDYLKNCRGKMLRASVSLLCAKICGGINPKHIKIAAVLEMIHTATLLHDDVIDDAAKRRYLDTANKLWGDNFAVLLGDYLLSRAFCTAAEVDDNCINKILADMASVICRGEMLQNVYRGDFEITTERYFDVIGKKTAVFFATACRLGAIICGADEKICEKLYDFGTNLGIAFQIADDIADCMGSRLQTGKTAGRDVSNKTLTLPVIYALRQLGRGEKKELLDVICSEAPDSETIVSALKSAKAIEYAAAIAADYSRIALEILDGLDSEKSDAAEELKKIVISVTKAPL